MYIVEPLEVETRRSHEAGERRGGICGEGGGGVQYSACADGSYLERMGDSVRGGGEIAIHPMPLDFTRSGRRSPGRVADAAAHEIAVNQPAASW